MEVEKQDVPTTPHPRSKDLLRILSTIYTLPIASDFRRPVELMYPKIAAAYLSVIPTPMDLGTLLLACMRDNATPQSIREGLNLVFTNSMNFNGGAPMMKALSLHLLTYAEGLFEEAVKLPFSMTESEGVVSEEEFLPTLLRKRGLRFETMCKTPLRQEEVRSLEQALRSIAIKGQPFESLMSGIFTKINEFHAFCANAEENELKDTAVPMLTLENLLRPLVEAAGIPRDGDASSSSSMAVEGVPGQTETSGEQVLPAVASLVGLFMHRELRKRIAPVLLTKKDNKKSTPKSGSKKDKANAAALLDSDAVMDVQEELPNENELEKEQPSSAAISSDASSIGNGTPPITLDKSFLPFLFAIDAALGELLVQLEERVLRGTTSSSVWQRPLMLGWAAAGGVWFPCMVLACPAVKSPSECKLAPGAFHGKAQAQALVDINVSRIPEVIIKQLMRLKSKSCGVAKSKSSGSKSSSASSSSSSSSAASLGPSSYEEQDRLLVVPDGFLLIEFYGTHDFGWVKAEAVLPFCVDGTKPSHNRVGSGVDGVRTASCTERWWLLETFQYLPPPYRARLIERIQIDRNATLMTVANAQATRTKPASSSCPSSSSSSSGKKRGGGSAKNDSRTQPSDEPSMSVDEDSQKADEMIGVTTEESDSPPQVKSEDSGSSESPSQSKSNGPITSFSWKEDDEDAVVPCAVPSLNALEESTVITHRPYFVPVVVGAGTSTQKPKKGSASASSGTTHTTAGRAGGGKMVPTSAATIARAAAVATALDYSDYSCLIHGGFYSSSLVPIDKRQSKRDIAKDKSLIFSRWAESVSPIPPWDSARRGNKQYNHNQLFSNHPIVFPPNPMIVLVGLGSSKKRDAHDRSLVLNESDDLDDDAIAGMDLGGAGGADKLSSSGGGSGLDTTAARKRRRYAPTYASDGMRVRLKPGRKAGWQASAMAEAAAFEYGEASEDGEDTESGDDHGDAVTTADQANSARNSANNRDNRESNIRVMTKKQTHGGAGSAAYPPNMMGTATIQGNFQVLVGGCTTFVAGDGCLLSRTVDTSANLFYGEHKKRNHRKEILRQELQRIAGSLAMLQSYASGHPHPPRMGHHPATLGSGIIGGKTFTQVYSQNRDYYPAKHATKARKRRSKSEPRDDDDQRGGTSNGATKVRRKPGPMKGWKLAAAGGAGALETDGKGPATKKGRGGRQPKVPVPKPEGKKRRGRIPTVHDPNLPRKGKMTVSMATLELRHFKALKTFADANVDIETSSEHSDHPEGGRTVAKSRVIPSSTSVGKDIVHDGRTPRLTSKPLADGLDLAGRGVTGIKPGGAAAASSGRSNGTSKHSLQASAGGRVEKASSQAAAAAAASSMANQKNTREKLASETEEDNDDEDDDEDDDSDGDIQSFEDVRIDSRNEEAAGTEEDGGADTESDDDGGDMDDAEENNDLNSSDLEPDDDDDGGDDEDDEEDDDDAAADDEDDDDAAFVEQFNAANTMKHMTNTGQEADDDDEEDDDDDDDDDDGPMEYEDVGDEFEDEEEDDDEEPQIDADDNDGGDDDEGEEEEDVQEYDDDDDDDDNPNFSDAEDDRR